MGEVVRGPWRHARASAGQRSGLRSPRGTPVSLSIGKTNSAGTPRLEELSQYQTSDCLVPISAASRAWPPARSHARFNASFDMSETYPDLGRLQPKNLSGTTKPYFGTVSDMKPVLNSRDFGRRIIERREELGWSQEKLAKEAGFSQSNIDWIEKGGPKDPRKQVLRLAEPLNTTPDWLLYGTGKKTVGPPTIEQLTKACDELPADAQMEIREALEALITRHAVKKKRA